MTPKSYWFYIEPFVHYKINETSLVLYNTLNYLSISSVDKNIINIIKRLSNDKKGVIEITQSDICNKKTSSFIKEIKDKFMGDILLKELFKNAPIQINPEPHIKTKKYAIKINNLRQSDKDKLEKHLIEISLYINSSIQDKTIFDNAYRQFLCNYNQKEYQELSLNHIENIVKRDYVNRINILGGNILKHSNLQKLLHLLGNLDSTTYYYFKEENIINSNKVDFFCKNLAKEKSIINIFVANNLTDTSVEKIRNVCKTNKIDIIYHFIIKNEEDLNVCEENIKKYNITNFQYHPYYDKTNIDFFKQSVFIEEEDILETKLNHVEIIKNQYLNLIDFGKLTILADGNTYTNINLKPIGSVLTMPFYQIIHKASISETSGWYKTRKEVKPCKECVFNSLCPPISNYERVINQYNLCNINV